MRLIRLTLLTLLISCNSQPQALVELAKLPTALKENSGLAKTPDGTLWTVQDSGNPAELYAIDETGKILRTITIEAPNHDWEDLASDENGNVYIGDFGNNQNDRRDLKILKVDAAQLTQGQAPVTTTEFFFPEQTDFPPKKSQRIFDVEAFFYRNGKFYLFTKNRSSKFDGTTALYEVPAQSGKFAAQKIGTFQTCIGYKKCVVTGADLSPDGKTVALLSPGHVWLFTKFESNRFLEGKAQDIPLDVDSQKEAICFDGNDRLLIADEKDKHTGGKLYAIDLKSLKP